MFDKLVWLKQLCVSRSGKLVTRFLLVAALVMGGHGVLSEANGSPENVAFAEAVRLNSTLGSLPADQQAESAREIVRILDLISSAYPDSLVGQRVLAGGMVGPIDLPSLRALVGGKSVQNEGGGAEASPSSTSATKETVEIAEGNAQSRRVAKEWFNIIVPEGAVDGGFSHAAFPSDGPRTHPGNDVLARCGAAVLTPSEGEVVRVVKAGDADFQRVGNAVLIKTPEAVLAFFYLGKSPITGLGPIEKGAQIGETGQIAHNTLCGVHFEIRELAVVNHVFLPDWTNVLAVGDWRKDREFTSYTKDPQAWLERLQFVDAILSGEGRQQPIVQLDNGAIYSQTPMTALAVGRNMQLAYKFADGSTGKLSGEIRSGNEGISVKIWSSEGVQKTNSSDKPEGAAATIRDFTLRLEARPRCKKCAPYFQASRTGQVQIRGDTVTSQYGALEFLIPYEIGLITEEIQFALIEENSADDGKVYPNIVLGSDNETTPLLADERAAGDLLRRVLQCAAWSGGKGETFSVAARLSMPEGLSQFRLLRYTGMTEAKALQQFETTSKRLAQCGEQGFGLSEEVVTPNSWVEITFGSLDANG